jgi:endo-1,4-beta-xylanase
MKERLPMVDHRGLRAIALALAGVVALALAPSRSGASPTAEPLRVPAERRGFYVGAAVDATPLASESAYRATLAREYNVCVAENVFKFEALHPAPGTYDFAASDAIADFARANGMKLRGHTLVWHNQLPAWVTGGSFTRDEAIAILRDHIATVAGRYRGRVWAWDVVNEAVLDDGSPRTSSFWYRAIGPDYVEMAFRFAHEADPDARLYYNDYGAEGLGAKSDAVYALVRDLKARGVPIDGVGWQMHVVEGFRIGDEHRANGRRLAALGLELSVTELDVRLPLPATAAALADQAATYRDVTGFCLAEPAFAALVTWGFTDKYSWIPGFFRGYGAALVLDERYGAKPAYTAMRETLADGAGDGPVVSGVVKAGRRLVVTGGGFDAGAAVVVAGVRQKTRFGSATELTAKKAGKTIHPGDGVRVMASDGTLSNEFTFAP